MTTAMMMERREGECVDPSTMRLSEETLQGQYEQLSALVGRLGAWLTGPQGEAEAPARWEQLFTEYREQLQELQRLGEQLRPSSLRDRNAVLTGEALADEIRELFA